MASNRPRFRPTCSLLLILLMGSDLFGQAHTPNAPPPPGVQSRECKGRTVPQLTDVTKKAGIKFEHLSAPEKKYIVESMPRRGDRDRLRSRWLAGHLFHERAHGWAGACQGNSARRALSQQSRRHVYRCDRQGRRCDAVFCDGRRGRRLQQRRLARHVRDVSWVRTCCIATMATERSPMLPSRPGLRTRPAGHRAQRLAITTKMASSTWR